MTSDEPAAGEGLPQLDRVWATAALLGAAVFALLFLGGTPLHGIVPIPALEGYFNTMILLGWPFASAIIFMVGVLLWLLDKYTDSRVVRLAASVLLVVVAVEAPGFYFVGHLDPMWFLYPEIILLYVAPLIASVVYLWIADRPTFTRMLGVVCVTILSGLATFVLLWLLLGGQTD